MDNKKQKNIFSSYSVLVKGFFAFEVIFMFAFFIIGTILSPNERDEISRECREFNPPWEQVLEDGTRIPVTTPTTLDAERGQVITLVTTLPDDIKDKEYICFKPVWQDVTIYIDGELKLDYNTKNSRPFGTNSATCYLFVELEEEDAGKELTYCFSSNSKYAGFMNSGFIGDRLSIWIHLLENYGLHMLITVFLLMMSFFCIITCAILKRIYKKNLPLNYLAWTLFFCAFWMISEMEIRQLMFKNVSVLSYFPYLSLIIIPLPLITYINDLQENRYQKVFILPMLYDMGLAVICTILQVFDIAQFVDMLPLIHSSLLMAIGCIITTITIDAFTKKIGKYLAVGIGIYGMILTSILELVRYYIYSRLSLGTILSLGLLFLLLMAIIKTGQDLLVSEKKKQQAIIAKEAQSKFLANMSHEIRTPINAIIGMNEMILRENDKPEIASYAQDIERASKMLLGLINDILDFSKIEAGQHELVEDDYHLPTLIKDELILLRTRCANKPITTHLDLDSTLPTTLYGDELKIKQVITNLLSNAVKYTNKGNITLKVYSKPLEENTISLFFSITDTGMGIKEEDLSQIFDSFKRLDLNKNRGIQGSGLGLNIVKQFVDLMKGDISIQSEYGKGSTFTISIPQRVIDNTPIESIEKAISNLSVEISKDTQYTAPEAHILVVDDNSINLRLMKELLKRTKIVVDTADSGPKALELTRKKKYHIIFMDHMMPEMDGIEALQILRQEQDNINQASTVVALTANAVAGCRKMYLSHGFDDYFSKPVLSQKLDELILQYLPKELICMTDSEAIAIESTESTVSDQPEPTPSPSDDSDYLIIDKDHGLGFCMHSEELYLGILADMVLQSETYLKQLDEYFHEKDWKNYAILAHTIKGNAKTIGALNFAEISYRHELAGKSEDEAFITGDYTRYVTTFKALIEKIKDMIN